MASATFYHTSELADTGNRPKPDHIPRLAGQDHTHTDPEHTHTHTYINITYTRTERERERGRERNNT